MNPRRIGLCFDCLHAQRIQSDRGSIFYRCKLSDTDPSFPKYPRLPVLHCDGYRENLTNREVQNLGASPPQKECPMYNSSA